MDGQRERATERYAIQTEVIADVRNQKHLFISGHGTRNWHSKIDQILNNLPAIIVPQTTTRMSY